MENEEKNISIEQKKPLFLKVLIRVLWVIAGVGVIVLFVAAMQKKAHQVCADVRIDITGAEKDIFIDERDVLDLINSNGTVIGKDLSTIDLRSLETTIKKNLWVKNAEMFIDNNELLHIRIEERTPVARVFTNQGDSYYIDSNGLRLPLSEKLTVRVPVFTNFPSGKDKLSNSDSAILTNVVTIGKYIIADSFWMAQVSQIDITPIATFEMIPNFGNQVIELGNADAIKSKFDRLFTFYKQVWLQKGMNAYSKIDVQYENQVVASKRGMASLVNDSAKAATRMTIVVNPNKMPLNDSVVSKKLAPFAKKMNGSKKSDLANKPVKKINKNVIVLKQNKVSNKSLSLSDQPVNVKKPSVSTNQPKAVMQKNE